MKSIKKRKILILVVTIIFLFLLVVLLIQFKNNGTQKKLSLSIGNDLEITEIGKYTGSFVEDGTDEDVTDVMMITIKNNGENTLQYAEIQLVSEKETIEFALSTLPPGKEMIVLEKNRKGYLKNLEHAEIRLNNVVFFNEEPNLYEDVFNIEKLKGALNIKNITKTNIEGPIAVYYKAINDNYYYGGITYRVVIHEGIKAGETHQVMSNHFSPDTCEIIFVTYAN